MTATNGIFFKDLNKSYRKSGLILKNFNLQIERGDFVVMLGPSGSGKSTFLRLLAGLTEPSSGSIENASNRANDKGFVFQDAHLMPWRSLVENVELPLELMGISAVERKKIALDRLSMVKLETAANLFPSELSGGMKMRGSLARALVNEPDLLLLDEPFAALDEQTRFKLSEDLRELWLKRRMTVVFVTHSVYEACFLANRILTLSEKPAQIQNDIKINLPVTRDSSLRTSTLYTEEIKRVYDILASSQNNILAGPKGKIL